MIPNSFPIMPYLSTVTEQKVWARVGWVITATRIGVVKSMFILAFENITSWGVMDSGGL